MQNSLFGDDESDLAKLLEPVPPTPELIYLAQTLPHQIRLGTCSWSCSGWEGMVWNRKYSDSNLSNYGLTAYNMHPLFRTVCIDHGFYDFVTTAKFTQYASQVDDNFRFMVKAPNLVTDPFIRDQSGQIIQENFGFLNVSDAIEKFVKPALEGLGHKLGVLVFQISPLSKRLIKQIPQLIKRLQKLLEAIPDLGHRAPGAIVAVEVRDTEWLTPDFCQMLKDTGSTYCLGLHAKMPFITKQLDVLRYLFPGPLVCRWNLNPVNGIFGYEDAGELYSPYNKIVDPDVKTRTELARVISGFANKDQKVDVAISNTAEGSAPLSVIELAKAIHAASSGTTK